jgi:hypothetical protein
MEFCPVNKETRVATAQAGFGKLVFFPRFSRIFIAPAI